MRTSRQPVPPRFFSERRIKFRIVLIALSYFLLFFVVIGRTVELHLADNTKLSKLAESQYHRKVTVAPRRGNILDTHGEELAIDVKVDSLYANPRTIRDPGALAQKLAPILDLEASKIEKSLSKEKKFVWIKRRLTPEESAKVLALKEENLEMVKENKRFYPNHSLAATVLGAVGYDAVALGGLELYYDDTLKSTAEPVVIDQDARGLSYSPHAFAEMDSPPQVVLTLDKTVQFIAEKELAKAVSGAKAKSGIAVVMDVQTGEILAMASSPDFDPNSYSDFDLSQWKNRVVTETFEPGSIFKAVTAAAALESGRISLEQKFDCEEGAYKVGKFTINDSHPHGALNLPDILRFSSNIGSFKIAQLLGRERFAQSVLDFGFGSKTGVDLPGESVGILAPPKNWSSIQLGTIAFGQGISATPLQIVNAYGAIANGGSLMKPFIVKEVLDSKGQVIRKTESKIVRRVVKEENAKKLTEMLKGVVGPGGTGTAAEVPEYGVAGKTGTAQKVLEGRGVYAEGKYIASFVGFAPADRPKLAVLVSINEPKGSYYGGVVAAPAFREIMRQALPYLKVPPRESSQPIIITQAEDPKGQKSVKADSIAKDLRMIAESRPVAKKESSKKKPAKGAEEASDPPPAQLTAVGEEGYRLPDWTGRPLREILRNLSDSEIRLSIEGSGLCVDQTPSPGQVVKRGSEVRLSFRP